jgi:hypothetical protein
MKPIPVDLNDHNKLVVEFKNESDRGVAVLAGSLIENYLAKYLKHHMVDDPKIDELFQGFGPFSDFGKRIDWNRNGRNGVAPSQVAINKEYRFYFAPKNRAILTFSALKRAI